VCIAVIVDNQAGVDAFGELDFCLLGNAAASHRGNPSAWPHSRIIHIGWPHPPGPRLGPYEEIAQIGVGGAASPARQRLTVTFLG
jgi:hypothetical protein